MDPSEQLLKAIRHLLADKSFHIFASPEYLQKQQAELSPKSALIEEEEVCSDTIVDGNHIAEV